jgi:hypothetical protein
MRPPTFACAVFALLLGLAPAPADEVPDLAGLLRPPRKEPAYASKRPLYGLAAFGPRAQKAVWMVLDKSKPDGARYDVLHIDLDADGDLTGAGERLTAGPDGRFRLAELTDPATGVKHKEFTLRPGAGGADPEVMLGLAWRGKFRLGGGYPQDPEAGYLHFAPRPADAPVLWLHGDGPFRFQRWYGGKLAIGGSDDFKVFLGQPGRGKSAFCAAQEHILPAGEGVLATLVYRDGMGKEKRLACELRERC